MVQAVGLWDFGGTEVLEVLDVVTRTPVADEVQVDVVAATVNPTDTLLRSGVLAPTMKDLYPPYIPGMEFAGFIHRVGDEVTDLQVGQPVMGIVNPRRQEGGAMNQRVVVSAKSVFGLKASEALIEAATVPMNGITALKAIEASQVSAGGTILITGSAGAVGGYVIQLAKHLGLRVVADSSEADRELVSGLGADYIVPRGAGMRDAALALMPEGLDGLIDAAVLGQQAWDVLREGAVAVSLRGRPANRDPRVEHRWISVSDFVHDAQSLHQVGELYEDGVITARVAKVMPMTEVASAHELLAAGGLRGRIVLRMN